MQTKSNKPSTFMTSIYPWIAISCGALFVFYRYVLQISVKGLGNQFMQAFHVNGAGLGNLTGTFFYTYAIMQAIFAGILVDRYGIRVLTTLAVLVCALGTYFFSISHTLLEAELARGLTGIGIAFCTVSFMKIAAVWFRPNQFAMIGGLLTVPVMIGAVFAEAPVTQLVSYIGWRHSMFYCAIIGIVIAALFYLIVRNGDKSHRVNSAISGTETFWQSLKNAGKSFLQVVCSKQNWYLTMYSGLAFAPLIVLSSSSLGGNYLLHEMYPHISDTTISWMMSLVFIGLGIGGPLLGWISDKLAKRKLVIFLSTFLSLISVCAVIYIAHIPEWLLFTLLFLFGFGTSGFMLGFAVGKEINKVSLAASVIAMINTGDAGIGALSQPLVGALLDLGWHGQLINGVHRFGIHDYHMTFLIIPIFLVASLIFLSLVKEPDLSKK